MNNEELRGRQLAVTALATRYCVTLEQAESMEREEFVAAVLGMLPRLYWEFAEVPVRPDDEETVSLDEDEEESGYYADYVDEEHYDQVRATVARVMGEQDTYLETFEQDMQYSETPIGASISEGLADIFQTLYNFVSVVKDTDGEGLRQAYGECREQFKEYWAQTVCNVMRPLNAIRYQN